MMTNGDHEGSILLSHPHTNNGFFSCSPLNISSMKKASKNPEYAEMRHSDVILTLH